MCVSLSMYVYKPQHSQFWPKIIKYTARATHQIPANAGGVVEGVFAWVQAVPRGGRPWETRSPEGLCSLVELHFQSMHTYARVRTRVWVCVCLCVRYVATVENTIYSVRTKHGK